MYCYSELVTDTFRPTSEEKSNEMLLLLIYHRGAFKAGAMDAISPVDFKQDP